MEIQDILKTGQPLVIMTLSDLREFMQEIVDNTINELRDSKKGEADPLLTPLEVCKMLKVHRMTLQAWKNKGYLVPAMVGGRCFYKKSTVLKVFELLNDNKNE